MHWKTFRAPYRAAIVLAVFIAAPLPLLRAAQESSTEASPSATRLALGAVSGAAKSQVMVPLFLTPFPPEAPVGGVSAQIEYQTKGITFLRAEKSFLLDGAGAVFQAKAGQDPQDPAKTVIQVEVETKGEPRKSLREGLILTLVFRIEPDAVAGSKVALAIQEPSVVNLDSPPKPVKPLEVNGGTIEVLAPEAVPYVGCFFFSH